MFCDAFKTWANRRTSDFCSTLRQHCLKFTDIHSEELNHKLLCEIRRGKEKLYLLFFRDSIRYSFWETKISRPLINRRPHLSLITSKQLPATSH